MMNFSENLEKPVVQYFHRIILITGIPVTNSHGIAVERAVNYFLALPAITASSRNMIS